MKTLNLTQHPATPEQVAAGVVEPENKERVRDLLTFNNLPDFGELVERAGKLARIAKDAGAEAAMIGGAPFFMRALENALVSLGIRPVYAFSTREVVEEVQEDGSVRKTAIFRHKGFVYPLG